MVASRLIARLGLLVTIICLIGFVVVIAVGSSQFSTKDLRTHGTALLGEPDQMRGSITGTLAVTPRR